MLRLTWCISRIQDVNINRDVHSGILDSVFDSVNDALYPNAVEVSGSHDLKTAPQVISPIPFGPRNGCSDSCVN